MKKEWFEPGPDGVSPFEREYRNHSVTPVGYRISAAFRALLAESDAYEQPALQVGDVVRLERYESNPNGLSWFESEAHLIGTEKEITHIYADGTAWLSVGTSWPVSACTLVRRAGDVDKDDEIARLQSELHARNDEIVGLRAELENVTATMSLFQGMRDQSREYAEQYQSERDAARAEVERLKSECSEQQRYVLDLESAITRKETRIKVLEVANDSLTQYSSNLTAERDALQARVDGGVRVWSIDSKDWHVERCLADNHSATLLIDHIADPGKMVDERVGKADRRETSYTKAFGSGGWIKRDDKGRQGIIGCFGDVAHARSNDRRKTLGTIKDRKGN